MVLELCDTIAVVGPGMHGAGPNPNDATEGGETSRRRNNREQGQVFVGEPYADFAVQQSLLEPLVALEHALDRNLDIRFLVHGGVALPKRAPAPQESDWSQTPHYTPLLRANPPSLAPVMHVRKMLHELGAKSSTARSRMLGGNASAIGRSMSDTHPLGGPWNARIG